ncbi:MAG: AAA family ATPase [Treponema sp.]
MTISSNHASEKYHIYLTGSNAFLLSNDLATLFTGRTFSVEIFPFSFKEFVSYFEHTDIQKAFDEYSMQGGMVGSYLYDTTEEKYNYIKEVFKTLIIRDIFSQIFLLMMHEISVLKNLTLCKNCKPVNFFLSAKKFD